MSLKKHFAWLALVFCIANFASADTLQLKDKAAVTGKILAEKPDAIVMDVGYTVLVVPPWSSESFDGRGRQGSKVTLTVEPLSP